MKKYVIIELDKERKLRFGMYALCVVEDKLDKNISQVDFNKLSMKDLATFIYAGLKHEDDSLTVDKVIELIDDYSDINTVGTKLGEAITIAFGNNAGKKPIAKK